ncbi:MAG: glycosyltransferase group 2 [Pelagibacteraceae bacterium]|nr:glycosyltransferase group 2 [Pelagibacteraceae bacterium]RZO91953.1 MAG: glycosyltransferase family 2 protein [alpha proteobacterium HIMB114]
MFSILIPTLNNLNYLKICINSIKKNSLLNNEIIVHVSEGTDDTINYLNINSIKYSFTEYNSGICEGLNKAKKLSSKNYVLYAHDDFYFCPEWDFILKKEIDNIGHNNFYLSGTMMHEGQIKCDYGDNYESFNEIEFLNNYKKYNYFDFQGSTWAPSVVHKDLWDRVGGLSEEFFPGSGSDPDFNMKLWNKGVRIFKGLNDFKVYHFGSKVLRNYKKKNITNLKKGHGSKSGKIFLLKWGISIKFFKKYYLKSNLEYKEPLKNPKKNILYFFDLIKCKFNYLYLLLFYKKYGKIK